MAPRKKLSPAQLARQGYATQARLRHRDEIKENVRASRRKCDPSKLRYNCIPQNLNSGKAQITASSILFDAKARPTLPHPSSGRRVISCCSIVN